MAEPAPRRRKSIPEIMSELKSMKGDGIGRVSIDEVVNLLQDTQDAYAPKSFKHSMKWAILAVLAVMVNAGLVLGIVELAKVNQTLASNLNPNSTPTPNTDLNPNLNTNLNPKPLGYQD